MKPKILHFHVFEDENFVHESVLEFCPYRQGNDYGIYGLGSYKCESCMWCAGRDLKKQTVKCNFQVLDLSLTYHWYDEIESGRKTVEYREMSDYWRKRLMACRKDCFTLQHDWFCAMCREFRPAPYQAVRFHRGQGGKQTMMYEILSIIIRRGYKQFGAPSNKDVFCICLGKRLQ